MSIRNGPGEGTWSVFAMKVVEERDALQHENSNLRKALELICKQLAPREQLVEVDGQEISLVDYCKDILHKNNLS